VFEFADGYQPVEFLQLGDRQFHTWQEAEERELLLDEVSLGSLVQQPQRRDFSWSGSNRIETLRTADGAPGGRIVREQHAVTGTVELSAVELEHDLYRLTARVCNRTPLRKNASRDEALLRSMASTHLWLEARGGGFVSAIDPPANCREEAAACRNQGLWPVLVGSDGQTDALFAAPIILYDYPQLAPESPGDLFDATEIDEILSLRILTLTENEKQQAAAMDERARALLERTESLDAEQLFELHGTFRRLAGAPVHD
jgi:hydrogenase maturation protease